MFAASLALMVLIPAGAVGYARHRAKLTRPAVQGGERRDFFGDGLAVQRRELA